MEVITGTVSSLLAGPPRFTAKDASRLLALALNRIRLQKRKQATLNDNRKREVATLLEAEKDQQAAVKALAVIHDDYLAQVRNIVEVYCEQLLLRVDVMQTQRSCPLDMVEQVCGICYIAPFLNNSPELLKLRDHFSKKYSDIVSNAVSKRLISPIVIDRLSRSPSSKILVDYYLGTVAMQFDIAWTPPLLNFLESSKGEEEGEDEEDALDLPSAPTGTPQAADLLLPSITGKDIPEGVVKGVLRVDANANVWVLDDDVVPVFIAQPPAGAKAKEGEVVWVRLDVRGDGKRSGALIEAPTNDSSTAPSPTSSTPSLSVPTGSSPPLSPSLTPTASSASPVVSASSLFKGIVHVDDSNNTWVQTDAALVFIPDATGSKTGQEVMVALDDRNDGKFSGRIIPPHLVSSGGVSGGGGVAEEAVTSFTLPADALLGVLKKDADGHIWFLPDVAHSLPHYPFFISPADLRETANGSRGSEGRDGDRVVVTPHQRQDGKFSGSLLKIVGSDLQVVLPGGSSSTSTSGNE